MSLDDLRLHNAARKRAISALYTLSGVPLGQPNPVVDEAIMKRDADLAVDITKDIVVISTEVTGPVTPNEGER